MAASLRLALAQINTTVGAVAENVARCERAIEGARARGADLVVFPEGTLPGYPAEDLVLRPSFLAANERALRALARSTRGITALVGLAMRDGTGLSRNAAAVLHDGSVAGFYHKQKLPNYGVFDDARCFVAGERAAVLERGGARIGLTICEDLWVRPNPGEVESAEGGAQLLVNLSASPFALGKPEHREELFAALAADLGCGIALCNLVGGQDELVFDGHSFYVDGMGRVLARAKGFEEDLLVVDVPLDPARGRPSARADLDVHALGAPAHAPGGVAAEGPRLAPRLAGTAQSYAALTLATRDYVRKNGFTRVVIGLSGGIDSALVACIAADALGPEAVVGVAMPSAFNTPESLADARALAKNLGIELLVLPIVRAYEEQLAMLGPVFEGTSFGTAEENLQARVRGNALMALSNKRGWLVLTTGNKSETAVGYSTLYGDTAGGFAVIKDLYKGVVYEHARHRNERGPVIPDEILTKAPSAELRPNQKDSDSLPPYDVLDRILEAYVEEDRSIADIVAGGFAPEVVTRVARLVDAAEYKRRQSPPGVKITDRAFGKDRRLPITNGWREEP